MINETAPSAGSDPTTENLMQRALDMLDDSGGQEHAACLLRHALDTFRGTLSARKSEEVSFSALPRWDGPHALVTQLSA
jgi:hypothetical protein